MFREFLATAATSALVAMGVADADPDLVRYGVTGLLAIVLYYLMAKMGPRQQESLDKQTAAMEKLAHEVIRMNDANNAAQAQQRRDAIETIDSTVNRLVDAFQREQEESRKERMEERTAHEKTLALLREQILGEAGTKVQ